MSWAGLLCVFGCASVFDHVGIGSLFSFGMHEWFLVCAVFCLCNWLLACMEVIDCHKRNCCHGFMCGSACVCVCVLVCLGWSNLFGVWGVWSFLGAPIVSCAMLACFCVLLVLEQIGCMCVCVHLFPVVCASFVCVCLAGPVFLGGRF